MKSFEKFNEEAIVHHIALKEGMSCDEVLNEIAPLLAAPLLVPAAKAALTGVGAWAAYNAAKKLMPQQRQQTPAVDYGQSTVSTSQTQRPRVTTTGGVSATPDIKPAPPPAGKETKVGDKPVSAPSIPKPKPRSTDWGGDPNARNWNSDGNKGAPGGGKPQPPKQTPVRPARKATPIRDIAAVGTGAAGGMATPPIGKKPAPQLGSDKEEKPKPEPPKPAPQLGAKPKPKPRVKTQAEIDREQGRDDANALPPARPRGTIPPPRINVPQGHSFIRSRTR